MRRTGRSQLKLRKAGAATHAFHHTLLVNNNNPTLYKEVVEID